MKIKVKAINKDGDVMFWQEFENPQDMNFIHNLCNVYKRFAYTKDVIIEEINGNDRFSIIFED